jgi:hypothetical protein
VLVIIVSQWGKDNDNPPILQAYPYKNISIIGGK